MMQILVALGEKWLGQERVATCEIMKIKGENGRESVEKVHLHAYIAYIV